MANLEAGGLKSLGQRLGNVALRGTRIAGKEISFGLALLSGFSGFLLPMLFSPSAGLITGRISFLTAVMPIHI